MVPFITRWCFATVVDGAEQPLRADAVVLLGLTPSADEVAWLSDNVDRVTTLGAELACWPSVCVDDRLVARTALEHLLSLGHRRIGLITGQIEENLDTPSDRGAAYRQALRDHRLATMPEIEQDGGFTLEGGHQAGALIVDHPAPPTAVFCACDQMAVGLMRACRERGVRVPQDLSVVGVEDHEMSLYLGLTTVRQPVREQGGGGPSGAGAARDRGGWP